MNPSFEIRNSILEWKEIAVNYVMENALILIKAKELHSIGIGTKDSLHLACAIYSNCNYFITTDKGILKKANIVTDIKIVNPINFIQLIEEEYENR